MRIDDPTWTAMYAHVGTGRAEDRLRKRRPGEIVMRRWPGWCRGEDQAEGGDDPGYKEVRGDVAAPRSMRAPEFRVEKMIRNSSGSGRENRASRVAPEGLMLEPEMAGGRCERVGRRGNRGSARPIDAWTGLPGRGGGVYVGFRNASCGSPGRHLQGREGATREGRRARSPAQGPAGEGVQRRSGVVGRLTTPAPFFFEGERGGTRSGSSAVT